MEPELDELVMLVDAANDGDTPYPYLVFDPTNGRVTIADDFETGNDPTARDIALSKAGALELSVALTRYIASGSPSTTQCECGGRR